MASKRIFRACKLQGLSLHADALARLTQELANEPSLALDDVLYAIKNSIDKSKMTTSVVTLEALESALDTLLAVSSENQFEAIQVFNAFETPKLHFTSHNNSYELKADSHRRIHAGPEDRLNLLRDRFISVDLRVKRNKMFSPPAVSVSNTVEYIELSRIESLLGVTGVKRVIGMLGQDERKRIYLEDLTSRIYIDLTNATYTNGLFTINCIVLVEGEVIDDVLHVHSMGFPPPEPKAQSLDILSGIDPLGVEVSAQQLEQIRELEAGDHHATFIVLSDVHLDDPQVMKHLDILFQGLESVLPSLFVLMGDFISSSIGGGAGSNSLQDLKEYFDELANLILKYPRLAEFSKFVLVPGPNDPGSSRALPRHPLPSMCTQELMRRVPNVTCTTNPCRIRYYTQDLVIFRDNLHQKMQRHALLPVISDEGEHDGDEAEPIDVDNEDGERGGASSQVDISKHLVKTIIDQAHLTPLPLMACPINWAFDSSLQLFPLPDVLILGDSTEQFQLGYSSVAVFHPGPFHVDFSFVLYRPSTNTTEFSRVETLARRTPEYEEKKHGRLDCRNPQLCLAVEDAAQNQMEMGDGTARNTQTPRQLARMKPATKNATTKDLRSEKVDRRGKDRDEDEDEAVRIRVLEELGWALDEDEPVKAKVKKKKKKPPHDIKSCKTPPKQPNHYRQRTAPKKSSRCPAPAAVEATIQNTTRSGDELTSTLDPEGEKASDPDLLLQLDVEQCRHPPSQEEEPDFFDSEVRRNSTFGDEFHRQQILDDLDLLPTASRCTTNATLDPGLLSTPADIETRDNLHVDPPDLQNATLVSLVNTDAKMAEQIEESEMNDTPAIASNSEVASASPLEIQVEEDKEKQLKLGNHQAASEVPRRAMKNDELIPAPVCNDLQDADGDPSSECEQVRNRGDRTEATSLDDDGYAPDPVAVELNPLDSVTARSDLELQPTEDHHQVVLPEFREQEAVGGLELAPVGQLESVKVVDEDSNFAEDVDLAFADEGGGDEMLQDHDSVSRDVPPVVDDGVSKATESSTVRPFTTESADPACGSEDDHMEKNDFIEETHEEADDCHHCCHQPEQPDCSNDGQAMSSDLTVGNDVDDVESGFSESKRLEGGANSQDAVMLENEPPPLLDQSEFTNRTRKVDQVTDPMKDMEAATSDDNLDFLGTASNVQPAATDDDDEEHATQGTPSSAPIDGVYEDNVPETELQKENDSEAVMTGSGVSKQIQDDTLQSVGSEFNSAQAQQPREIVGNIGSHGEIECWEASLMAESPGEFHPIRHDTAIDNEVTGSTELVDTESTSTIEMVAPSAVTVDSAPTGDIVETETGVRKLVGPPTTEVETDLGMKQSGAAASDAMARGDAVESNLLKAIGAEFLNQVCGSTVLPPENEDAVSPDPTSCSDATSTIARDVDNKQDSQQCTGENSSDDQHSPCADAVPVTESATPTENSDSNQNVEAFPSETVDNSSDSRVVIELSECASYAHKTNETIELRAESEVSNVDSDGLVRSEHKPEKVRELSQTIDVNLPPAMDTATDLEMGGAVTQAQATNAEVAARRIQRQYRCFVQRQILADQLKFLVSQHHRQVRKKTRRASQKAAAVVALLAAVGDSSTDPTASEVQHPPSSSSSPPPLELEQHREALDVKEDAMKVDPQASTAPIGSEGNFESGAGGKRSSELVSNPAVASLTPPDAIEEPLSELEREGLTETTVADEASETLRKNEAFAAAPVNPSSLLVANDASQDVQELQTGSAAGDDDPAISETGLHCHVQEELLVPVEISPAPSVHPTWPDEPQHSSDDGETKPVGTEECLEEAYGTAFAIGDGTGDTQEPPPLALALLISQNLLTAAAVFEVNRSEKAELESGLEADNGAMPNSSATRTSTSTTAMDQEGPQPSNAEEHDAYLRSRAASIALAALAFAGDDDDDEETDFVSSEQRLATESEELAYETEYPVASQSGWTELSSEQDSADIHYWERYLDAATNKSYYYNPSTQVSQWTLPEDAVLVIDKTAENASAWSEQTGLTASSLEEVDQAQQQQQQQQEAWHQVREQSLLLESAGGWGKYLMAESATTFFYHHERDDCFLSVDSNDDPIEFSEAKAQLLYELHQSSAAESSGVEATDGQVMVNTGEGYEADFAPEDGHENDGTNNVEQWGLRRDLSQSAKKRGEWQAFVDAESHQVFYYNAHTGESTWETPAYLDDASCAAYYVNLATGETSWEKPDDFDERTMTTMTTELLVHQELNEATEGVGELQRLQRSRDDQTRDNGETQVDEEEDDYVIRIDEHSAEQLDELF